MARPDAVRSTGPLYPLAAPFRLRRFAPPAGYARARALHRYILQPSQCRFLQLFFFVGLFLRLSPGPALLRAREKIPGKISLQSCEKNIIRKTLGLNKPRLNFISDENKAISIFISYENKPRFIFVSDENKFGLNLGLDF